MFHIGYRSPLSGVRYRDAYVVAGAAPFRGYVRVEGRRIAAVAVLQDRSRRKASMQDGRFPKAPRR